MGIARFVMRTKEYLVALRPADGALELSTMLFADEVVDPAVVEELSAVGEAQAAGRELDVAKQLIASLEADFDASRYRDDYRERVLELVERKAQGEQVEVIAEPEAAPSPVPDLMGALKASLDAVRAGSPVKDAAAGSKRPAKKPTGAKKPAPAKKPATAKTRAK